MEIHLEAEAKKVLVARYQYPQWVVPPQDTVVVDERNPYKVPYQNGAVSFDFVEVYVFECDGHTFQCANTDSETYYWGQELSLEDVLNMPAYKRVDPESACQRYVLTDWGAVIHLANDEFVVPHPSAFDLPADMQSRLED